MQNAATDCWENIVLESNCAAYENQIVLISENRKNGLRNTIERPIDLIGYSHVVLQPQQLRKINLLSDLAAARCLIIEGWRAVSSSKLIKAIRRALPNLPIMVASIGSCENDRICGYECGADDFLELPCSDREIVSRIRRLTARANSHNSGMSIFDFKVYPETGIVSKNGRHLKLSRLETRLLLYLVKKYPRPSSRAEILRDVFRLKADPGTNIVEVHVHRLRSKLDGDAKYKLIKTMRGSGYLLNSDQKNEQPQTMDSSVI